MIYELQCKEDVLESYRVFPTFDWHWRPKKGYFRHRKKQKLDQWLLQNPNHPATKQYSLNIGGSPFVSPIVRRLFD